VQPPRSSSWIVAQLHESGFRPSAIEVAPTATLIVDLTADVDTILGSMQPRCRKYVRSGERKGITVRCGTEADLATFYRLHRATSKRQNFPAYSLDYFKQFWQVLAPHGYANLILAEYEGEAVCAKLFVPFGDTVSAKLLGWSGDCAKLHPNEVLQWGIIKWAKENGFRYYDFEGIERHAAEALARGEPLPEPLHQTPTAFKVRFGGQPVLFPEPYVHFSNPVVRLAYRVAGPTLCQTTAFGRVVSHLRTH
jgi:lipid II:glycine glycyltransferase (peptidoglycan interpeptide bridge formation enzyme)